MPSKTERCISCNARLSRERAAKYPYCTAAACVKQNFVPLRVVAVGVNKSNDAFELDNDRTRAAAASGELKDPRRASYGAGRRAMPLPPVVAKRLPPRPVRQLPGTPPQQRLARLYISQGHTPAAAAAKIPGLTAHDVSTIALSR